MAKTDREIITALQDALDIALVGRNHLRSNLAQILGDPSLYSDHVEFRKGTANTPEPVVSWLHIYEEWSSWRLLMKARETARDALQDYDGEVRGCFRP